MCYQLVELYSICRCPYLQHAVDRCSLHGLPGHGVTQRTIFAQLACADHTESVAPLPDLSLFCGIWPEEPLSTPPTLSDLGTWTTGDLSCSLASPLTSVGSGYMRPEKPGGADTWSSLPGSFVSFASPIPQGLGTAISSEGPDPSQQIFLDIDTTSLGLGGEPPGSQEAAPPVPSASTLQPRNIPLRTKRPRVTSPGEADEASPRDTASCPPKRSRLDAEPDDPTFACPYWKRDPRAHRPCARLVLRRIRDVKQHLHRRHAPAFYCERCLCVFAGAATHGAHVAGAEPCTLPDPPARLAGLSHAQVRALKRKVGGGAGGVESWYAVWDVVFPGAPRPASVYVDGAASADLCEFREYCSRHGAMALWSALEAAGLWDMPARERGRRGQKLLDDGLDLLYETWRAEGNAEL